MYTFDGPNKLIILDFGTITFDADDLYSRWKDEMTDAAGFSKWPHAFETAGGEPIDGSTNIGSYFFVTNDWRIRPQEANHTLVVVGNLLIEGGGSPFVDTLGAFTVRVESQVAANSVVKKTQAEELLDEIVTTHTTPNTWGEALNLSRDQATIAATNTQK